MQFTFGIITNKNIRSVNLIIDSIEKQNIPDYEIIVVGIDKISIENTSRKNTKYISFNENIYPGWITKKKNIITQEAVYENIVYMHDYIVLDDNWYNGFLKYGNNFDIIINKINNSDGSRFRDWVLNIHFLKGMSLKIIQNVPTIKVHDTWFKNDEEDITNKLNIPPDSSTIFLDYDNDGNHWQNYIYISGSYFICKKHVMIDFPLNETLLHCQGEDVEWSQRVRTKYQFKLNKYSSVKLLKYKQICGRQFRINNEIIH
jgi:hypothetical protein